MFDRRLLQNFDWILLFLLILIGAISLLNLYSATFPIKETGGWQIFIKQINWYLIGFAALLLMTTFDYHLLERFAYPFYLFSLGLLLLVLLIGNVYSGSQRWLYFGGISFQPSELAKIALVVVLAKYFDEQNPYEEYRLRDLWQPFLLVALPALLILMEPDLGTALTLVIVSFSIFLFVKIRWTSLLILVASTISAAPFIWFQLKEYQQKRILTFINPSLDPLGAGYHINQSKIAIGSGNIWFCRGGSPDSPFSLPHAMGDQYCKKFERPVWIHSRFGNCGDGFLAARDQCVDDHRPIAGRRHSPCTDELWRIVFDGDHDLYGASDEYQYAPFHVSVKFIFLAKGEVT